jgi:ParB family transcriptional regulator, chromosome partitioning protein
LSSAPDPLPGRRGLGRGLEVLLGGPVQSELAHLPVESLHASPRQPRRRFDHEATRGLADSIRTQGVVQPVVVRPRAEGGYELIAGERRWRAAREAGLPTVPAVVRDADDRDSLLLALVENVVREDLSPVEEARAYAALEDEFGLSLGELAERVGLSKQAVSNRIRLLDLSDDILGMVERGELTEGHARAVLAVPDQEGRRRLAQQIVAKGLTVREAERAARWKGARQKPRKAPKVNPVLADRACAAAQMITGRRARMGPGRIELLFADETELAELAESLEAAAHLASLGAAGYGPAEPGPAAT